MQQVFVSPPFDITHTLIYETIDNKMALKLEGSKAFPNLSHLVKLAQSNQFKIRNPKKIIESLSDKMMDYLQRSNEIQGFTGLRQSTESSISMVMTSNSSTQPYRHHKQKKFE